MPGFVPVDVTSVVRPEHWEAYHRIRRSVLYEGRGRVGVYDANHPDDCAPGHHPLLLLEGSRPVGVARLDVHGDYGIVRTVAISPDVQRAGYGRRLMAGVERLAAEVGLSRLEVNAAADAVGFYQALGWALVDGRRQNPLLQKALPSRT